MSSLSSFNSTIISSPSPSRISSASSYTGVSARYFPSSVSILSSSSKVCVTPSSSSIVTRSGSKFVISHIFHLRLLYILPRNYTFVNLKRLFVSKNIDLMLNYFLYFSQQQGHHSIALIDVFYYCEIILYAV